MKALALVMALAFSWAGVVQRIERSIVPLQVKNESEQLRTVCTAVVISSKHLLSEAHCFDGTPRFADAIPVSPVWSEKEFVILEATGRQKEWRPIQIRRTPLKLGEPVLAMGFGFAFAKPIVTTGVVSSVNDPSVITTLGADGDLFDMNAIRGQSGGAIVDEEGALISLVRSVHPDDPFLPSMLLLGGRHQFLVESLISLGFLDN